MAIRQAAAPPTPWSQTLARPQVDESAYVHISTSIIGDVEIGANVMIAPGVSIRADEDPQLQSGDHRHVGMEGNRIAQVTKAPISARQIKNHEPVCPYVYPRRRAQQRGSKCLRRLGPEHGHPVPAAIPQQHQHVARHVTGCGRR